MSRAPQPYQGGEASDGRRIYVGNINYELHEDAVRNAFTEYGQITSMSYKQGFAFIDYADQRDAEDAIASMNGKQIGGRTITVELSGRPPKGEKPSPRAAPTSRYPEEDYRADSRGGFGGFGGNSRSDRSSGVATANLFVANIPENVVEEDIRRHFSKYGEVLQVKFLPKKSDTKAAFVDFANVDQAREAHSAVNIIADSKLRTDYNARGKGAGKGAGPPTGGGYSDRPPPPRYDDRGPPPPRYEDRGPPPRYDERRYDDRAPPPPRYDDRRLYDERDRGPPPPRYDDYPPREYAPRGYDDRRYEERRPALPERERERDYPPPRDPERERERDYPPLRDPERERERDYPPLRDPRDDPYGRDPYDRPPPPRDPRDLAPRDPYDRPPTRDPYDRPRCKCTRHAPRAVLAPDLYCCCLPRVRRVRHLHLLRMAGSALRSVLTARPTRASRRRLRATTHGDILQQKLDFAHSGGGHKYKYGERDLWLPNWREEVVGMSSRVCAGLGFALVRDVHV